MSELVHFICSSLHKKGQIAAFNKQVFYSSKCMKLALVVVSRFVSWRATFVHFNSKKVGQISETWPFKCEISE